MLVGLSIGLVIAAVVYVRASDRVPPANVANDAGPAAHKTPPATAPAKDSAKPPVAEASSAPDKRFDFYEILPQYQVVVPEVESPANTGRASRSGPVEEPGSYVLQVGSFNGFMEADRLQAKLALLGIESRVQKVTIDDDVFHRVRIGPITDLTELNRVRRQLREAGIESMLLKAQQ
jgi:cell division protein FtsN